MSFFLTALVTIGRSIETMGADAFFGETNGLADIVNGVKLEGIDTDVLADDFDHIGIFLGLGVVVELQTLHCSWAAGVPSSSSITRRVISSRSVFDSLKFKKVHP